MKMTLIPSINNLKISIRRPILCLSLGCGLATTKIFTSQKPKALSKFSTIASIYLLDFTLPVVATLSKDDLAEITGVTIDVNKIQEFQENVGAAFLTHLKGNISS